MFTNDNTECSTKVTVISQNKFDKWLEKQPTFIRNWCLSNNFKGENGKILNIPYPDGRLKEVLIGEGLNQNLSGVANFSSKNIGNYYLFIKFADSKEIEIQKAWAWGGYKFNKSSPKNLLYVINPETLRYLVISDKLSLSLIFLLLKSINVNVVRVPLFLLLIILKKAFSKVLR